MILNDLVPTYFLLKYILQSLLARLTPLHLENVDYKKEMVNFKQIGLFRFFFILLLKIVSLQEHDKCLLSNMFFFICSEQGIQLFRRAKSVACLSTNPYKMPLTVRFIWVFTVWKKYLFI